MRTRSLLALALVAATSGVLVAQTQPAPATPPAQGSVPAVIGAERSQETATVTFTNRPIVELRARVLGRSPLSCGRRTKFEDWPARIRLVEPSLRRRRDDQGRNRLVTAPLTLMSTIRR